jgi:hypothetical protein
MIREYETRIQNKVGTEDRFQDSVTAQPINRGMTGSAAMNDIASSSKVSTDVPGLVTMG